MPPQMMADIDINETSGVDHPAHLEEGWVVVKSADPADIRAALDEVEKFNPYHGKGGRFSSKGGGAGGGDGGGGGSHGGGGGGGGAGAGGGKDDEYVVSTKGGYDANGKYRSSYQEREGHPMSDGSRKGGSGFMNGGYDPHESDVALPGPKHGVYPKASIRPETHHPATPYGDKGHTIARRTHDDNDYTTHDVVDPNGWRIGAVSETADGKATSKMSDHSGVNYHANRNEAIDHIISRAKPTRTPARKSQEKTMDKLPDDVLKAVPAPVRELLEKQAAAVAEAQRSADEANARLAAEINKSRDAAKATMLKSLSALSFDDVDGVAKSLRELDDINPELARIIEGALTKANGQAESAELFKELGSGNRPATGSAEERLTNLAKARSESTGVSFAKAMDEVAHAEPALYAEYVAERRG